jgi:hypothetical protein
VAREGEAAHVLAREQGLTLFGTQFPEVRRRRWHVLVLG